MIKVLYSPACSEMKEEIKACKPKLNPSWTSVAGYYATQNPLVQKSTATQEQQVAWQMANYHLLYVEC